MNDKDNKDNEDIYGDEPRSVENTSSDSIEIDTETVINIEPAQSDAVNKKSKKEEQPFNLGREIFEWVYTILIALLIAFLIKGFIFDIVKVDGDSMKPTLHHLDRLVVTKIGYTPNKGDIIILDSNYKKREIYLEEYTDNLGRDLNLIEKFQFKFKAPNDIKNKYYVKRIIALPGQTIDLRNGNVYVDDVLIEEAYYSGKTYPNDSLTKFPMTVDENCVFVMGDNRGNSRDSRSTSLGQVPYKAILGKSQFRIMPIKDIGVTK